MEHIASVDTTLILTFQGLFYLLTISFIVFTLFATYHWFTYGTEKATSMLALAVYLFGSMPLFLIMALLLTSF